MYSFYLQKLNAKTVPFQANKFSISTQFSFIWPIEMTLSGATTPSQNGPGNYGSEGIYHISQRSNITGTSPSDYLVSYLGHFLASSGGDLTPLQRRSWCILQPQQNGQFDFRYKYESWQFTYCAIKNGYYIFVILRARACAYIHFLYIYVCIICLDFSGEAW